MDAYGNNPLKSGVADSDGPSLIKESLIPPEFTILRSSLNPTFHGIGRNTTAMKGYVSLLIQFLNTAALSGDDQAACVLLVWVEFQVMDKIACGYLIRRHDVFHSYEAIIDEGVGQIIFSHQNLLFKIPITNGDYFNK